MRSMTVFSESCASFMLAPEWNSGLTVRSQLKLTEELHLVL
ncbi:hypothetical protein NIES2104_22080 [Leptolyngbya sp. NIES-2104]|nr:hypothetical protein NIES2104_22080 [Leptolyngbya sp. NIES-2104]